MQISESGKTFRLTKSQPARASSTDNILFIHTSADSDSSGVDCSGAYPEPRKHSKRFSEKQPPVANALPADRKAAKGANKGQTVWEKNTAEAAAHGETASFAIPNATCRPAVSEQRHCRSPQTAWRNGIYRNPHHRRRSNKNTVNRHKSLPFKHLQNMRKNGVFAAKSTWLDKYAIYGRYRVNIFPCLRKALRTTGTPATYTPATASGKVKARRRSSEMVANGSPRVRASRSSTVLVGAMPAAGTIS